MIIKEISSLQHPIVKHFFQLRTERSYRHAQKRVLVPGKKLISELAETLPLKTLLTTRDNPPPSHWKIDQLFYLPAGAFKKITGLEAPEPIAAEIALPTPADLSKARLLLVCDGISDPGNLGALIRSALALGWEGVFITDSSADPFNEKSVRAAQGATFRLPLRLGTVEELADLLVGRSTYIADAKGNPLNHLIPQAPTSLALILGNEAHGVSLAVREHGALVAIPMQGSMESLNVAAAGAILMFSLRQVHAK